MTLKTIFERPVDRPIEGVIKADDEASLRLELEEYVLTNEIEKRLENFLEAYNNYTSKNGVWISGFFGSGKSHLLKMLALVLENRLIDGIPALDLFLPKCKDNQILRGDLKQAAAIPSKSILFNIDQKADVISKTQIDALLAVFVKVFDEMCGYYGKQPYIAQFERELDNDNLLDGFKKTFATLSGKEWEWGRTRPTRVASYIDQAFNQVTGQQTEHVLDKHRDDYHLSIEDFANQVQDYVEQHSADFRLNFFVDEVGQFIADNVKLMTNLQTIAESLATKCRGRAWVIVTAQEDMTTVIGEMNKQQGNDFSKIQDRFENRMKLTSTDVAEVIQKRLLMKNENGSQILSDIYHTQSENFKTLFDFADRSKTYKNFQDRDHFIHSYPFIPYQFALFQSAIQNLSLHNAFEGKHSSVGERSMLGVFQQVAIQISDHNPGELATFDLMFEGIRTALKGNIQRSVLEAEKHVDQPFAIKLLKALFLVKYVKEFNATIRNLSILMLDGFDRNQPKLLREVEEALNILEQQSYIQRTGESYEYLTDEEKDVEDEIKNTSVESSDVMDELQKIIFDQVIKNKKIRYQDNAQDYPYSRIVDEKTYGRQYELGIHVFSPFYEHLDNENLLTAKSTGSPAELFVIMPADDRLMRDLLMYKRTVKYINQNISSSQNDAIQRILADKGFQNQERYAEIQHRVKDLLGKARMIVAGAETTMGSGDAQTRISQGFHEVITRIYPHLRMLRSITYSENDISRYVKKPDQQPMDIGANTLPESEQEMFAFIQSNARIGVRTTIMNLKEQFAKKPYGWYPAAIMCTLAKLCARSKVEVRSDGNLLEDADIEKALTNSHAHGNVLLDPQVEFTSSQVRALKDFYEEFFDTPPSANEAKPLGTATGRALQTKLDELERLTQRTSEYPFLHALLPVIDKLKECSGKPYSWYVENLANRDDILDMKEDIIDPILTFMNGPQRVIYDEAASFVRDQQPNFDCLPEDPCFKENHPFEEPIPTPRNLKAALSDPECFKGNAMTRIKSMKDALAKRISEQVHAEIALATSTVQDLKNRICGMEEFTRLTPDQQQELTRPFDKFTTRLEDKELIAVVTDSLRRFQETEYPDIVSKLQSFTPPPLPPIPPNPKPIDNESDDVQPKDPHTKDPGNPTPPPVDPPNPIVYVAKRNIPVPFDKVWLADETDVERYLKSMRKALLDEIRKGKRIQI